MEHMNPRYVAYARTLGFSDPDACFAAELENWPGGVMAGFMVWMEQQWMLFLAHWNATNPDKRTTREWISTYYMDEFDVWLQATY